MEVIDNSVNMAGPDDIHLLFSFRVRIVGWVTTHARPFRKPRIAGPRYGDQQSFCALYASHIRKNFKRGAKSSQIAVP
ncbi:hypothetical protein [Roseovarius sp. THAF27]|uniref:hypothetical protein n=1 Tax=Roseovarius sp. THAF27 TaxID=2587850 RepID=UPI0012687FF2|nr:hypothetical protein [Roseovarius sp. THAF27]